MTGCLHVSVCAGARNILHEFYVFEILFSYWKTCKQVSRLYFAVKKTSNAKVKVVIQVNAMQII